MNKNISNYLDKVISFHTSGMEAANYPSNINKDLLLTGMDRCDFLSVEESDPCLFYYLDDTPKLPSLEFPVIKYLTVLGLLSKQTCQSFAELLQKNGKVFLVLLESYNQPAYDFLSQFNISQTYYCQKKLLCCLDRVKVKSCSLPEQVTIKNFIPGEDEEKYVKFYNQVLGYLGNTVNKTFVENIVSRSSFDPQGYFLAESKGTIVGFISIEKEPWGQMGSQFGYIYQIGVTDSLKSSGLAAALLKKACDFAVDQNIDRIGVGVRKSNLSAINFFSRQGFKTAYEVAGYQLKI